MDTRREALAKAIEVAGGQKALGRKIGVGQSMIWYWLNEAKQGVAAEYARPIAAVTGIPAHELRPDIFTPQEAAE